jgi:hypothetical protein
MTISSPVLDAAGAVVVRSVQIPLRQTRPLWHCEISSHESPTPNGVGVIVGVSVGVSVGVAVGVELGVAVGVAVGLAVGVAVGLAVGATMSISLALNAPPFSSSNKWAWLLIIPSAAGEIMQVAVKVTELLTGGRVMNSAISPAPIGLHVPPPEPMHVQVHVSDAGKESVSRRDMGNMKLVSVLVAVIV